MRLRQPANGARAAIDPVFLAAAVRAGPGELVLDIGCGSGAATLCLAARVPACRIVGLELQPQLAALALGNAGLNNLAERVAIVAGDLLRPPPPLAPGSFDHVMANPPFLPPGRGMPGLAPGKATATVEGAAGLADWVRAGLALLRPRGSLTMIHRADRIDALLAALAGRAGEIALLPLWPMAGRPAGRVLVCARKQVAAPARLLPGLVLHEADGRFTPAADAVLRHAEALPM